MTNLEIYDCTLREGEQAAGASFSLDRRLELFKILDDFGIDYIEVGWPIASEEILESFKLCKKIRKNAKIVAFGSTSIKNDPAKDENLLSIIQSESDYACIFGKSWLDQVEKQLKISPEENLKRIKDSIRLLRENKIRVFFDAEHYFDGFKSNSSYAIETLITAHKEGAEKIILCDTNGGTLPAEVENIIKQTKAKLKERGSDVKLGVHFHNDCGLALTNTLVSLPYITQVQGTINGIGERVGNLNFSEFLPIYIYKMNNTKEIDLTKLKEVNEKSFRLSGVLPPESKAFVGETAFAHKGGVHIDATSKGASYEHVNPSHFGNKRIIILNTLGGGSGIISCASEFGYNLDKKDEVVKTKIEELYKELRGYENKGYRIGHLKAEHFLLIEKYFGELKEFFNIDYWRAIISKEGDREKSDFYLKGKVNGQVLEIEEEVEGGPIDAAYKCISELIKQKYRKIEDLKLVDFNVSIANQKMEESTVRTLVRFEDEERFETVGVDKNIIASGIEAITKGFKYYLNKSIGKHI